VGSSNQRVADINVDGIHLVSSWYDIVIRMLMSGFCLNCDDSKRIDQQNRRNHLNKNLEMFSSAAISPLSFATPNMFDWTVFVMSSRCRQRLRPFPNGLSKDPEILRKLHHGRTSDVLPEWAIAAKAAGDTAILARFQGLGPCIQRITTIK
jgi:hypothetical protein